MKLFHLGVSDADIAAQYDVTVQAVNKRYLNMNPPLRRKPVAVRVTEMVNSIWDVKVDRSGADTHHNKYAFKNLKVYMRMRLGDTVSATQQASADRFIRRLVRDDTVVDYQRDTEEGWQFVPRLPIDDRRIIRWPADKALPAADLQRAMALPEGEDEAQAPEPSSTEATD
ncbi:hypothetical protein ACFV98_11705 [Streptomyces violascens]|uniref:hypothetical protein n=1 Tax=Streptomyces violascens TaxID=67381 RepID=UPI00365FC84D